MDYDEEMDAARRAWRANKVIRALNHCARALACASTDEERQAVRRLEAKIEERDTQ